MLAEAPLTQQWSVIDVRKRAEFALIQAQAEQI